MINNNPETVSTDYDTSDKLYFEPITLEHVQAVIDREKPRGVVLQFGGQTPLKLSHQITPVLGTSPEAIDICEDRDRFNDLAQKLGIRQPEGALANTRAEAAAAAERIGFPLLVRPSYVLGGRAMRICYNANDFEEAVEEALEVSGENALLLDRYLEGAVEYDVDALCDGENVYIAGIMEHVEEAGIHSGDSTAVIPPVLLSEENRSEIVEAVSLMALELGVMGVVNVQFAVLDGVPYVFEVNPRASRTLPFVSKAKGVPVAALATRIVLGEKLTEMEEELSAGGEGLFFVKAPVFPWARFPGSDVVLGPEMRSTGEVMGVGRTFGEAYAKALMASGLHLPQEGGVFLSIRDEDKAQLEPIARPLHDMGFHLIATTGTHKALEEMGVPSERVFKVNEGRPDIVDQIKNGAIQLMINTPTGKKGLRDELAMRLAGLRYGIPCITTLAAGRAALDAIGSLRSGDLQVVKLQEIR